MPLPVPSAPGRTATHRDLLNKHTLADLYMGVIGRIAWQLESAGMNAVGGADRMPELDRTARASGFEEIAAGKPLPQKRSASTEGVLIF
jgi:hypothetical protein